MATEDRQVVVDMVDGESARYIVGFDPGLEDPHVTVTVVVGPNQSIRVVDEPAPIADEIARLIRRAVQRTTP